MVLISIHVAHALLVRILHYEKFFIGSLIIASSSAVVLSMGMFGMVLSVFLFTIKEVKNKVNLFHPPLKNKVDEIDVAVGSVYEKYGLEASAMEKYAQKINHYFSSEQYLDSSFNLNTLSSALKIPRHSLSQVFSQHYQDSIDGLLDPNTKRMRVGILTTI